MKITPIIILLAVILSFSAFASQFPSDYMGAEVITGKLASSTDIVTGSRLAMAVDGITPSYGIPSYVNANLSGYGDIYQIKKNGDMLEGAEYVNDVVQKLGSSDMDLLQDSTFITSNREYRIQQTLTTPYNAASTYEYARGIPDDDTDTPAAYMLFPKDVHLYNYSAAFFAHATSEIDTSANSYKLKDFEDGKITLLGKEYIVLNAEHPAANSVNLVLLSGAVKDTLKEGETKEYAINGTYYSVEAVAITDVSPYEVKFKINGVDIRSMSQADAEKVGSLNIAVSEIIPNEAGDTIADLVVFYLDSYKVELKDTDVSSDSLGGNELKVNDKSVYDTDVQISASDPGLSPGSSFSLSGIKISWTPSDKYYLGAEKFLSEIAEDKNALFGNLDYYYYGSNPDNEAEAIELVNNGNDRYTLSFENIEGDRLDIPLFYYDSGFARYGKEDDVLVVDEGTNIRQNDYLVVTSDGSALPTKAEETTKLFRYKKQNIVDDILSFQDMSTNEMIEVKYTNNIGYLRVGGNEIKINVSQDSVTDGNITVDLNNDGSIDAGDVPVLVTRFKGKIALDTSSFNTFQFISPKAEEGPALSSWAGVGVTEGHDYMKISVSSINNVIDVSNIEVCLSYNYDEVAAAVDVGTAAFYLQYCYDYFTVSPFKAAYKVGDTDIYEGSDSWGRFFEWHKNSNSPDNVYIAAVKKQDETLFFIASKDAAFHYYGEEDVDPKKSSNTILMGGPCVNEDTAKAMGLPFPSCGNAVIKPGTGFVKEYAYDGGKALVVFGHSSEDTINAVNKLMAGLELKEKGLVIAGDLVTEATGSIAEEKVEVTTTTTTMPEVKSAACAYSPNAKSSYDTKVRKFGLSMTSTTDVWVNVQGTKGKLYTKDDKPFEAAFGVDWLDYAVHILKDNCNGAEVQKFTGRQVNGDQEFIFDLNLPSEGCYCVKIEDKDLVLDSARITILPAGKFEMMFGTG